MHTGDEFVYHWLNVCVYNVTPPYLCIEWSCELESLDYFREREFDTCNSEPHSKTLVSSSAKWQECVVTR